MLEIECIQWLIGLCVVFCVQVGWFVGEGNEFTFFSDSWCKCECVGRQKGLCGSCLIHDTSMHYIKWIRMFGDDVTWPEHALAMQGVHSGVCADGVCSLKNISLLWAVIVYLLIRVLPSTFFSCALTPNIICLQCLGILPPSTETWISGTSQKLPLWFQVS